MSHPALSHFLASSSQQRWWHGWVAACLHSSAAASCCHSGMMELLSRQHCSPIPAGLSLTELVAARGTLIQTKLLEFLETESFAAVFLRGKACPLRAPPRHWSLLFSFIPHLSLSCLAKRPLSCSTTMEMVPAQLQEAGQVPSSLYSTHSSLPVTLVPQHEHTGGIKDKTFHTPACC